MDIVRFGGGLGNQMFQYALMEALKARGRDVKGCLRYYDIHPESMRFELTNVFKNISIEYVSNQYFEEIDEKWKKIKANTCDLEKFIKNTAERFFWVQLPDGYTYEPDLFKTKGCTFVGCWESEQYFADIKDIIAKKFTFMPIEKNLIDLSNELISGNYVSVHIRRGDYLQFDNKYGGICTKEYYMNAINYINNYVGEAKFIVFSDDIEWVKSNLKIDNAVYCTSDWFEEYQNWYDMYLMSLCKHNIIANSSFSWWGAWLNQNKEKKVICPKRWINMRETPEIYPDGWIKL